MARLFVPLDVEFATNDRILAAGPLAAYLYVCSLAYCKRQGDRDGREGFVHASALKVLAVGFPGKAEKHASALVDAGLWQAVDGGWVIPAWLKHNKSTDQLAADKQAAKEKSILGNHRRHHEAKGEKSPDCPLCYPSPQGSPTAPTGEEKRSPTAPKEKGKAEGRQREGKAEAEGEGEGEGEGHGDQSSHNSKSVAAAAADDDRKVETIIDHIIAKRTEGRRIQDPIAHLRTSRANFARQERLGLDMMLAKRPHMLDSPELAAEFYLAQMARGGAA